MPAFSTLQNLQNSLIRKALQGSLFGAPFSAAAITTLTGPDSTLLELPSGYFDWGLMTDDGQQFSRAVDLSDVTSFSRLEPTRSDISSDVDTVQVSLQQTNIHTISLVTGTPEEDLVPDATTGELSVPKPTRPAAAMYRLLALAVDLYQGQEVYIARYFPKATVTEYGDTAFAKGDDPILWPCTFRGQTDDAVGYAKRDIFGGPGWKALIGEMGFAAG